MESRRSSFGGLSSVQVGVAGGVASLDGTARLPAAQLPTTVTITVAAPTGTAATDTAAIQTALDAANTAGGGLVQLQAGTYRIAAPGTPSNGGVRAQDNTTLAGAGIGVTVLKLADGVSTDVTGIIRTPSSAQNARVTFRDLTVDGNAASLSGSPIVIGFFCGVTPNATTTDTDIACLNVEIKNCSGYGFDPHERTTRLRLVNCISHDNGAAGNHDGFTIDACYDSKLIGCIAYSNGRHGFNLVTASNGVELIGCTAYSNGSNGVTLQQGAKHCAISGGHFHNNTGDGISINGLAQVSGQDTTVGADNRITGALIESNGAHGIHLTGATRCHIAANTIRDSSQTTTNTSHQIYLDESGSNYTTSCTIVNNDLAATATNKPKYGITEKTANDDNNFIAGNRSIGAVTAQLSLAGLTSLALAAHNGTGDHAAIYLPSDHGLLAWTWDPNWQQAAQAPSATGTLQVARVRLGSAASVTNIVMQISGTVGSGLTSGQNFAALYRTDTLAKIAQTADQSTAWTTTGTKTMALAGGPYALTPGDYYVVIWSNGSTMPTFTRANSNATAANIGTGITRFGTADTSITTTAPSTLGTITKAGPAWWAALS